MTRFGLARGLAALLLILALTDALMARPLSRDWVLPGTRPGPTELTPATDDCSVSVRRVGMRSRDAVLDGRGELVIYPVVLSPRGVLFAGYERTYPAGSIGRRWLYWDFPTQFRAPDSRVRNEAQADFGDHLVDTILLGTSEPERLLPSGTYQVKWVVGGELIDNGDQFRYAWRASQTDR